MQEIRHTLKKATQAFGDNRLEEAVDILTAALSSGQKDGQIYAALGTTYQKMGRLTDAKAVLIEAVAFEPTHLRCWILKGAVEEALKAYSAAIKSYQSFIALVENTPNSPPQARADAGKVKARIPQIMQALEAQTRTKLTDVGLSQDGEDQRFQAAIDILFGHKSIYYQQPHQLYYPELPQRQFYSADEFSWQNAAKDAFPEIRKEAEKLLRQQDVFAPYLESEASRPTNSHVAMVDNPDWSAFYLIRDGEEVPGSREMCPAAFALMDHVDLCKTPGGTPSVLFSLLKPGAHIPPHTGMLNTRLICHLPLVIPESCGLRVGNETVAWREGEMVIFDDSIEHEAWNKSDKDRIILLFDVWRPELSSRERTLISKLLELAN